MASKYPSQCLKCNKKGCKTSGSKYMDCNQWLTWFRWWWKRFRSALPDTLTTPKVGAEKFRYEHPDLIRRYLQDGPCKGCKAEKTCEMPCRAYWNWWDARIQIARKRFGL